MSTPNCGKYTHPLLQLTFKLVLFVLGCPFNLISISELICTLDLLVLFVNKFDLVQDRHTGRTIGARHESGGLYQLTPPVACVSLISLALTHQHLGHLESGEIASISSQSF